MLVLLLRINAWSDFRTLPSHDDYTHRTHAKLQAGELNLIAELERTRTGRSVLACGCASPRASGLF